MTTMSSGAGDMTELDPATWDTELRDALLASNGETARDAAFGESWSISAQFPPSAYAGSRVLNAGGTAADAFIAAVLVDCVMTAGASTLGGCLDVLVRNPDSGEVSWLDGLYRVPLDERPHDDHDWTLLTTTGRATLVPGIVRGLESLWQRFGRVPWEQLFIPARHFAQVGFPAYPRLTELAALRQELLSAAPDAAAAYLPGGNPVQPGETIRQVALARTLETIAREGADALYLGKWGEELVTEVNERGGVLRAADLSAYVAEWADPLSVNVFGWDLYVGGSTTFGSGLLRSLNACEALDIGSAPLRELSASTLYAEMQADAFAWSPALWHDREDPDPDAVIALQRALSKEDAARVAGLIRARTPATEVGERGGTHAVAATDAEGLVIAGGHSISWTGWGTGLFVGGVPLNAAGYTLIGKPNRPGRPVLGTWTSAVIATHGQDTIAAGATNSGNTCGLQMLNDTIAHGFPLERSIVRPRWGSAAFDTATGENTPYLHCETAIPDDIAAETTALGQPVRRADGVGLGYWAAVRRTHGRVIAAADPRFRGAALAI